MMVAEQIWDWRVRALFAAVCAIVVIATIILYVVHSRRGISGARTRRAFGRMAVTLLVIAVAEMGFFKDGLAFAILVATGAVIGIIGLRMPYNCANGVDDSSEDEFR